MFPFTHEMFMVYHKYKTSTQLQNLNDEYNYAIAQLTDESTDGDYADISYLKQCLTDMMNECFSPHEQKLLIDFENCMSYQNK